MPPKIKFKVVKPSIGKSLTGLSKAEMNKLSPLELFGKLPTELRKKVVNPKETGVKVGIRAVSSYKYDEVDDEQLIRDVINKNDNYLGWIKGITPVGAKFYMKNINNYNADKLNPEDKRTMIKIIRKSNKNSRESIRELLKKNFNVWKEQNKGKNMKIETMIKSFTKFINSNNSSINETLNP